MQTTPADQATWVEWLANAESRIPSWVIPWCKRITSHGAVFIVTLFWGYYCGRSYERELHEARAVVETAAEKRGWRTVQEASVYFDIPQRTISRWAHDGKIEGATKSGRRWKIPIEWRP